MISLDQVLLLEKKVESAVAKIQQLQEENDALNKKCLELTNALSSKTEQLSNFETDQNKIEEGIRNALSRLNSIENSVLNAAGKIAPSFTTMENVKSEAVSEPKNEVVKEEVILSKEPASTVLFSKIEETVAEPVPFVEDIPDEIESEEIEDIPEVSNDDVNIFEPDFSNEDVEEIDENPQDNIGFDIF